MDQKEKLEYVRGLLSYDNLLLEKLDCEAKSRDDIQPFIELEGAKLLSLLIRLIRAENVLEIGMGIAYSTIWLATAVREVGGSMVTVDNHPRTLIEASSNIKKAGVSDVVEIRFGDAQEQLPLLKQEGRLFDLIFQDCGKSVYNLVYEDVYQLLSPGGIVVSDDTLMQYDPGIRKGLGKHVRAYNERLFSDSRYYSTLLPVGQGIALSVKI
ncbi:MAG: class I SAM-dependent methyltransferase [Spirochaetales bacterium]|jgi:predicted O-methyltransferase YrrM|nr:class I SAM-dependent methyltransferase [Spirochaetales bacterium]